MKKEDPFEAAALPFTKTLVQRIAHAHRVTVLTGAGISAESGVPTFRDPGGLWQKFRPRSSRTSGRF